MDSYDAFLASKRGKEYSHAIDVIKARGLAIQNDAMTDLLDGMRKGDISPQDAMRQVERISEKNDREIGRAGPVALSALLSNRPAYGAILSNLGVARADGSVDYDRLLSAKEDLRNARNPSGELYRDVLKRDNEKLGDLKDDDLLKLDPMLLKARALWTLENTIKGFRIPDQLVKWLYRSKSN